MIVQQGDVIWVKFAKARGSEPAGRRPALVVQANSFNQSKISTVVVAAITSNLRYENMPGNVRIARKEAGLSKPSVVNISQIHSIDRAYIESKMGALSSKKMNWVRQGLRILFDF